jgi:hypothetical protein
MGNFYTNLTVKTSDVKAVVAALEGRAAFVAPPQHGCIVVYDEESEDDNDASGLASELSTSLRAPVLVVTNYDDDVLWLQLWIGGDEVDNYDSCPSYFDDSEATPPTGGDADALCEAFGGDPVRVEAILRRWNDEESDEEGYVFEVERHGELVEALGLSPAAVGKGFRYLERGELPTGVAEGELIRVG